MMWDYDADNALFFVALMVVLVVGVCVGMWIGGAPVVAQSGAVVYVPDGEAVVYGAMDAEGEREGVVASSQDIVLPYVYRDGAVWAELARGGYVMVGRYGVCEIVLYGDVYPSGLAPVSVYDGTDNGYSR